MGFVLLGKKHGAQSWADMFVQVCGLMYDMHASEFHNVLTMGTDKHKWFSQDASSLLRPRLVPGTDVFVYTNLSANDCLRRGRAVIELFGHDPAALVVEPE